MVLECDKKAKEERMKGLRENRSDTRLHVGNVALQCGKETLEKSVSEIIKGKDSDSNCEEYMKHKYGEQWNIIDTDARNVFASCTPSMIKCTAGINQYGERIKKIDKSNKTAVCPICGEIEDWDHVLLCEHNKNNREKWVKDLEMKMKKTEQHKHADEEEKVIVQEMLNDVNKYFNNNDDYYTNQQLIGHRELFRGVVVKEWVIENQNNINFHAYNKVLVKSCVQFYHECWKRRCVVLHDPEVQKKVLKEEVLVIMEEANEEAIEGLNRYVQIHTIKLNEASVEELLSWIRSVRAFKKRACKNKCQDIRNMLNVIVN